MRHMMSEMAPVREGLKFSSDHLGRLGLDVAGCSGQSCLG